MLIGIPGYEVDGMFGVHSSYLEFATNFGQPVILTPANYGTVFDLDGVILPGGADVDPDRYGVPGFHTGRSNPHLEYFDRHILQNLLGHVPVFGICRGLQTLNVVMGGDLVQHLKLHPKSSYEQDLCHKFIFTIDGKQREMKVNSFHHQAIGKLADDLEIGGVSDDGVIECVYSKDLKIFAVQWHPERMHDQFSIINGLDLFRKE